MPRPELYPVKKVIGFDRKMLAAIDNWRRKQEPLPSVSDAIRALIEKGLGRGKPAGDRAGDRVRKTPAK